MPRAIEPQVKEGIKPRAVPAHLNDDQLRPEDRVCPICGHHRRSRVVRIQRSPDVWLMQCRGCHGASASRMPSRRTLERISGDPGPGEAPRSERFVDQLLRSAGNPRPLAAVDLLDHEAVDRGRAVALARRLCGAGVGRVRIRRIGPGRSVDPGDERIEIQRFDELEAAPEAEFDFVLSGELLGHVPYPRHVLRQLLLSLRPGGLFHARTACELPRIRLGLLFRNRPRPGYPRHLHDLGQAFWEKALVTLDIEERFDLVESRPSTVDRSFRDDFFGALVDHTLNAPWYLLGGAYGLVGGWEVLIRRGDLSSRPKRSSELEELHASDSAYQLGRS